MIEIMRDPIAQLFENARRVELAARTELFAAGQPVRNVHLVLQGRIHLVRHTPRGSVLILQNAGAGAVLAEASAYSAVYHCDAIAAESAAIAVLTKAVFRAALAADPALAEAWGARLARGVQAARVRAEIRALPTVAERMDAWLGEGNALPAKGRLQDVAAELGVTREAFYRELARRRRR
jgi:CRP-like cAMP-binding protein